LSGRRRDGRKVSAGRRRKKRDAFSVALSEKVLAAFGCPNVRRGEGSDEWRASMGNYRMTPDLIAGPLVGGGDPSDFYIDVFEPTGDQNVRPLAGNPKAAVTLLRAVVDQQGSFKLGDLGDTGESLYKPMNDKIQKYAAGRGNTPMFGLSMYFTMTGDQYVGPVIAALQAPMALDRAFGIAHHLGIGAMDKFMREVMGPGPAPGHAGLILSLPFAQPLSFILYVALKQDRPRAVLLVNSTVRSATHPYGDHPVIQWLRGRATPDAMT
jgi:hypothetical protein